MTQGSLDGFYLQYLDTPGCIPKCWSITGSVENATEDMVDLFNNAGLEPISVFVEHWEGGLHKETIHLFPDTAGEGRDV